MRTIYFFLTPEWLPIWEAKQRRRRSGSVQCEVAQMLPDLFHRNTGVQIESRALHELIVQRMSPRAVSSYAKHGRLEQEVAKMLSNFYGPREGWLGNTVVSPYGGDKSVTVGVSRLPGCR